MAAMQYDLYNATVHVRTVLCAVIQCVCNVSSRNQAVADDISVISSSYEVLFPPPPDVPKGFMGVLIPYFAVCAVLLDCSKY